MYQYTCKVVLIGDAAVGKSCLLLRFIDQVFQPVYDLTIGVEFGSRVIETSTHIPIRIQAWDTAGQEAFRSITRSYYRGASAVILMYDVSRRETFVHIVRWLKEVATVVHPCCVLVLVGNKVDLHQQRQISTDEARQFAQQHNIHLFFETSAKHNIQIDHMFRILTDEALRVGAVIPNLDAIEHPTPQPLTNTAPRSTCSCI